jgi:serine/threonine-protein kinase
MAELVDDAPCASCGHAPGIVAAVASETPEREPGDATARRELSGLFDIELLHRCGAASLLYRARDLRSNAHVALKVISRRADIGAGAAEAFKRAAAQAGALEHVHIVPVYSAGATEHCFWCTTEYVEGSSLVDTLRHGRTDLAECLRLAEQVGLALQYAHECGVVHADLKPANVLLDPSGRAHVTDFWVPRVLERLGVFGAGRGTARHVEYLAPEDVGGEEPGPPADQYALAVVVYECLSGQVPWSPAIVETITDRGRARRMPRLADVRPDLPHALSLVVERALREAPGERFPTVLDFVAELEAASPLALPGPLSAGDLPAILLDPALPEGDASPPRQQRRVRRGVLALTIIAAAVTVAPVGRWWTGRATAVPSIPAVRMTPPESALFRPDSTLAQLSATFPPAPTPSPMAPSLPSHRSPPSPVRVPSATPSHPGRPLVQPGRLYINSTPWGQVYVDGVPIGNTPKAGVPLAPGTRRLRVERAGFVAFERTVPVVPGQAVRFTDIVLREGNP